jgi:hypothetical protein
MALRNGSRGVVMEMTTSDQQASETEFDDIAWTSVSNPRRVRI